MFLPKKFANGSTEQRWLHSHEITMMVTNSLIDEYDVYQHEATMKTKTNDRIHLRTKNINTSQLVLEFIRIILVHKKIV